MCVRPWIKAADVCPLTSTGPCLLHLWQAATARPLKCSLTTSSSSTIISSALVKAPPPASPNPARPPLVSSPTAAVCWSSMPSHANSSVIYVGHPSLCAAGWHKSFGHVQWQCLTLFMNQWEDAKTRNIYCLFAARFNQRESLQREKSARSQSKASPQWSTAPLSHTVTVVKRKKKKN